MYKKVQIISFDRWYIRANKMHAKDAQFDETTCKVETVKGHFFSFYSFHKIVECPW